MRNKPNKTSANKISWGFKLLFIILVIQMVYLGLHLLVPTFFLIFNNGIFILLLLINIFVLAYLANTTIIEDKDIYK